jgi:hypothetical protein
MAGRDKHFPGPNFSRFRVFLRIKRGKTSSWSKLISYFRELIQGLTSKAQQGKYLKVIFPVFFAFLIFFLGDIHISRPLAGVNEASDQMLLNMRWTNFFG